MRQLAAVLILSLAPLLAACEDPNSFMLAPALVTDTVELAAPSASSTLPSALDVTATTAGSRRGRFPERVEDAEQWDLAIRIRNGQLVFVPAGALGLRDPAQGGPSRSGITQPLNGTTFEGLREAPTREAFVTDSAVAIQRGAVYAARSRRVSCLYSLGENYAKLQVLDVKPATSRLTLQITTNTNCSDPRLVEED